MALGDQASDQLAKAPVSMSSKITAFGTICGAFPKVNDDEICA